MRKNILILSILIFCLFFQSILIYSLKKTAEPDVIWEYKAPEKSFFFPEFDQPSEGREFYIFRVKNVESDQKKVDYLIIDSQTGKLKREYEIQTTEDKLNLYGAYWRNNYFIKVYKGRLDFYKFETMEFLYSIKHDYEGIIFDIYAEKKILILNKFNRGKDKTLTFHNLDTGREIFSIKYEYSAPKNSFFNNSYYIVYEESDTIAILENGKNFSMYNLLDGSLKGKVKNGIQGEFFQTFDSEKENEMYIVTSEPFFLRKINIKTGKLLSEVKFKKSGITDIGFTLTEIDGLVYLTYQDEAFLNSNGIACIDTEKNEVVWDKKLSTAHLINLISQENDIITFDNKTVYRLNKKTGKEVWSIKLNDPKVVRKEREGLMVGLGLGKTSNLSEELGYSGFVLLDEKTGKIKWQFINKRECISNLIYNTDNEYVYFADTSNFYILNPRTGELVVNKKIDIKNEISSSLYIKEKDQMLFITRNSVVLYDIKTEKVIYETNIKEAVRIYFLYEAKLLGDYLVFTGIVPLRSGVFDSLTGPVMRTLLNINTGEIIWSKQIGVNHFEDTNGLAYYIYVGTNSTGRKYNFSMFWPRRDLFEENLFVICEPDNPDSAYTDFQLKAYKIFPDDTKPSSSEIKNALTIFGVHNKVLGSGFLKRLLSGMNDLWEKE